MIHIQKNDTIIDIIESIENDSSKRVILDFPIGHPVLHNYISLKILKSKAKGKTLVIATSDNVWKKIGKSLWIEYSSVKNNNFIQSSQSDLIKHNYSFGEYFKYQISQYISEFKNALQNHKKLNSISHYSRKYRDNNMLHVFLIFLMFSIFLFMGIYYLAINKTYVYISSESVIKKEAFNFIMQENKNNSILWNNKYIQIKKKSENFHSSHTYAATNIIREDSEISSWNVEIYNYSLEEIALVPKTRLMTLEWIVYQLPNWITIPAWAQDNFWISPWKISVRVSAQSLDINWKYSWSRWNISSWIKLTFPWLWKDLQDIIYAESIEDFSGWTDSIKKTVSQEDIETAIELFTEKLKTESFNSLKNNVIAQNTANNTKMKLLTNNNSISYSQENIIVENDVKPWDQVDNFTLRGSIVVSAYTFNSESIIQKLKTIISEKSLESVEKIIRVDEDSLRMTQVIYSKENPYEVKATFEIESLFLHDFLHSNNTYLDSLVQEIRGLKKENAENILLNDEKISSARIEIRPFFIDTISNIASNIVVKVE